MERRAVAKGRQRGELFFIRCLAFKKGNLLPDVRRAVLAEALVVKAVDLCNLAALVVSTNQGDAVGVADLRAGAREAETRKDDSLPRAD